MEPRREDLSISFNDGSIVEADVLLGADGINSAVRRFFVPSSAREWTGWVAFRSVFDAKLVEHIPGVLDEANHWWGPERTFFASKLGRGLFTIVGGWQGDPDAPYAPYKDSTWNSNGDLVVLKDYYHGLHPVVREMIDVSPYTRLYPNTFASSLATWVHGDGRVTYAGDAAHAHGGAFAAGGSLALDDAYAFALAILEVYPSGSSHKPSLTGIRSALELYERTRKSHTDRLLETVHAGNLKKVQNAHKVVTDEALRQSMTARANPSWMHEHDAEVTFAQALE